MKTKLEHPHTVAQSTFLSNVNVDDDGNTPSVRHPVIRSSRQGTIGCVDPASLSTTQLQLCTRTCSIDLYAHSLPCSDIEGISEEIAYEQRLTDEFRKESTCRIDACTFSLSLLPSFFPRRRRLLRSKRYSTCE